MIHRENQHSSSGDPMAAIATAPSFITWSLTAVDSLSASSPSHSVVLRSLHPRLAPSPRLSICHGKLSDSGEVTERINEAFFEEEFVMADEDGLEEEDDNDDAESSLELFFKFLQSLFRKVSKRARRASRSVLPDFISPQLLSFAVDGVLLLTALSIMKALLEVVCTLGGTVFVAILLLRLTWAAIAFFQANVDNFNQNGTLYNKTLPVT